MIEAYSAVVGAGLKYGTIIFIAILAFAIVSGFIKHLRRQPKVLASVLIVALLPIFLAVATPYYILHKILEAPMWLSIIVGVLVYGFSLSWLEERLPTKFQDE